MPFYNPYLGDNYFKVVEMHKPDMVVHCGDIEGSEYAIIYIEENLYVQLSTEIDKFKDSPLPAIILIPGKDGSSGLGLSALNAAVERAVGTNILGD